MSTPFETAYSKLNPQQKQAVDTIEGPVMVIAGPGTGKTQVLTLRIANILATTDTNPQNILALTFTEAATATMRARLISLIGTAGYRVRIQTFHGFCQEVISTYPEYFPFRSDSVPASELQTYGIIEQMLDNPKLTALRTPGSKYHYLKKILSAINTLKSEGITPPKFHELVKAEQESFEVEKDSLKKTALSKKQGILAKQFELADLYTGYQKTLREQGLIDFTDMIMHTVEALRKSETLRQLLQENLQYILVDEYQDTNGAQNTVVDLLASFWGESANLFVVGDPHQTIFRFQGASFENTIGFLTRYPRTQVITLSTGYRCPTPLYTASHTLIAQNTSSTALLTALAGTNPAIATLVEGISTSLTHPTSAKTPVIALAKLPSELDELSWIAEDIQQKISSGIDSREIAVLVKTNDQASTMSTTLSQYGIVHRVDRTTNALETNLGQQILSLLRTLTRLATSEESTTLYPTLSAEWMHLPPVALMSLTRAFSKQKKESSFLSYLSSGWSQVKQSSITKVSREDYELILATVEKLVQLAQFSHTLALPNWIAEIYKELGITTWAESHSLAQTQLATLSAFHAFAVSNFASDHTLSAEPFITLLDTMEQQKLSLPVSADYQKSSSVTVATIHKAKGQEWEQVYIPFLRDGVWGGGKAPSALALPEGIIATQAEDAVEEDERRLLYVALTRAKSQVTLSYAEHISEAGRIVDALPSQYLLEIPEGLRTELDTSSHEHTQSVVHALEPVLPQPFSAIERAWIQSIVSDMTLSVSALNTYLRDPKEFFTSHILRVPQAVESHLAFGNAIHSALEQHYKLYYTNGNTHPPESHALSVFQERLAREILTPSDFESRKVQGETVLREYLSEKRTQFPEILATEEGFGWKRGPILLGDIKLSGKVDRMDVIDAGERLLHVIDYKTGKQKSANQIEGKVGLTEMSERERHLPEPIRGAMKRQLLFYKLLLSLDPIYQSWTIGKATFDFVQSDSGKFVERSFYLENGDVNLLSDLIKEVMEEIRGLKFLENLS